MDDLESKLQEVNTENTRLKLDVMRAQRATNKRGVPRDSAAAAPVAAPGIAHTEATASPVTATVRAAASSSARRRRAGKGLTSTTPRARRDMFQQKASAGHTTHSATAVPAVSQHLSPGAHTSPVARTRQRGQPVEPANTGFGDEDFQDASLADNIFKRASSPVRRRVSMYASRASSVGLRAGRGATKPSLARLL